MVPVFIGEAISIRVAESLVALPADKDAESEESFYEVIIIVFPPHDAIAKHIVSDIML